MGVVEPGAGLVPVLMESCQPHAQSVGVVLPFGKPARERDHLVEVGVQLGTGAVRLVDDLLQVFGRCGCDLRLGAYLVEIRVVVGHDSVERGDFLVQAVDVLLVEVEGLQLPVSLVGGPCRVVDEQLDHHAPCVAVDGGRTVGKRVVEVGAALPLLDVGLLPPFQFGQAVAVRLDACRLGSHVFAQRSQRGAPSLQELLHVLVVLVQAGQQFAQLPLRLRVVGVVCRSTDGAGRPLLQLLAQLHDVLALAQRVGRADALVVLLGGLHRRLGLGGL